MARGRLARGRLGRLGRPVRGPRGHNRPIRRRVSRADTKCCRLRLLIAECGVAGGHPWSNLNEVQARCRVHDRQACILTGTPGSPGTSPVAILLNTRRADGLVFCYTEI